MKKNPINLILLFTFICTSIFSSCQMGSVKGSGHMISETRKVDNFDRVEISGGYQVILKQDSSLSVKITADDNLMKLIRTQVSGGTLKIYSKKSFRKAGPLTVQIGLRSFKGIKASGAVEIEGNTKINAQDVKLDLSGASKLTMNLNAANVLTQGSGATELYLTGQAASHKIDLSGVGKLKALDFVVGVYKIETSGASNCEINVLKSLDVNSSGASEITYRGNPSSVNNNQSGASSIKKIN